jgi:hypothetical protein
MAGKKKATSAEHPRPKKLTPICLALPGTERTIF